MTRVVFFGTPELCVPFLETLVHSSDIEISLVVTQKGKPQGRKGTVVDSAVKTFSLAHNVPVIEPDSLKTEEVQNAIANINPDLFVVFAYGKIIPEAILSIPKRGAINVHPSKLPLYRGPSPLQAAIANLETETAITIMLMDAKMDHGPILSTIPIALPEDITHSKLEAMVMELGPNLLLDSILGYLNGSITPIEQDHEKATVCHLLKKEDGNINWTESAETIDAKRRAYERFPGIFTYFGSNTVRILDTRLAEMTLTPGEILVENGRLFIGTGSKALEILSLQPAGKKPMSTSAFLNGNPSLPKSI